VKRSQSMEYWLLRERLMRLRSWSLDENRKVAFENFVDLFFSNYLKQRSFECFSCKSWLMVSRCATFDFAVKVCIVWTNVNLPGTYQTNVRNSSTTGRDRCFGNRLANNTCRVCAMPILESLYFLVNPIFTVVISQLRVVLNFLKPSFSSVLMVTDVLNQSAKGAFHLTLLASFSGLEKHEVVLIT